MSGQYMRIIMEAAGGWRQKPLPLEAMADDLGVKLKKYKFDPTDPDMLSIKVKFPCGTIFEIWRDGSGSVENNKLDYAEESGVLEDKLNELTDLISLNPKLEQTINRLSKYRRDGKKPKFNKLEVKLTQQPDSDRGIICAGTIRTTKGLWHKTPGKLVNVTLYIENTAIFKRDQYTYINAYFNKNEWNTKKDGLIYTDGGAENDITTLLQLAGFKNYKDIGYTEQGKQGENYISLSTGTKLSKELRNMGFEMNDENYED
jgi:hypothetical protein